MLRLAACGRNMVPLEKWSLEAVRDLYIHSRKNTLWIVAKERASCAC